MIVQKVANDIGIYKQMHADDLWTVFLVDDDADDQALATRILKDSPHIGDVIWVSEALGLLDHLARYQHMRRNHDRHKVLILLDIHMPEVSGLVLLEQLRSNPDTCDYPIIMVTGDQKPDKIFQSYRQNASCFIHKPITEKHLAEIHTVLEYGENWYSG